MGAPLLTVSATIMCPHGGKATIIPSNTRVTAGGVPVAVQTDVTMVAGCAFTVPPGVPTPCIPVQWLVAATRVTIMGKPALTQQSQGMTTGTGPPVPVTIASPGQVRALGT